MTSCLVCRRDTSPVKIGGQLYCSECGTPVGTTNLPSAPKRLTLDLSPRNNAQVQNRPMPSAVHPKADNLSNHVQAATAAALHRRVKPSRVLDLRGTDKRHVATPEITHTPHHVPASPPETTTHERHLAHFNDRFEQAKQIERSPLVHKFGANRLHQPKPPVALSAPPSEPVQELSQLAATHHAAMVQLVHSAARDLPPEPQDSHQPTSSRSWRPHLSLSANASRTVTTIVAVGIMSGYVWVQNYPKMALQSANSQAGVAASLPSYLPSSYTLKRTDTSPGLVTLNFGSPSSNEALKIEQHRTNWDSSSLLDNFVAKNTDDYSAVLGQGLTIYLFNNNQAAWVNHGIWYSIAGAGHLSREQILKIAYSL